MNSEEYKVISRADAKAQGLKHYFTGKPCKNGGVGLRFVISKCCLCETCRQKRADTNLRWREENSEYMRRYRDENKEQALERQRRNYKKNKDRVLERNRRWYEENKEQVAERIRLYREDNQEKIAERERRYYGENKEQLVERSRRWREKNPEKAIAQTSKRRAAKIERTPSWFGELDQFVLEEAYDLAAERLAETGIEWHVDHLVPMRAKKASGLHCAANIQVIPAVMNLEKYNKMRLTKPLEWLR